MFGKKKANNAGLNKINPGVNIKFGVQSIYYEKSGLLFIRDFSSKEGNLKELRFSIIEPITGIDEVDERLLNMIFLEASIQGYDPVSLISYKNRYFGKGFSLEFMKFLMNNDKSKKLENYISGIPYPDTKKVGYAVKVVNANSPKEEPFISLFGFNGYSENYYPISTDFLSVIFEGVRMKGFIPVSLEHIVINDKFIIDTEIGVSELTEEQEDAFNKAPNEDLDLPAVIRRRPSINLNIENK